MANLNNTFGRLDILANPKSDRVKKVAGLSKRSVRKKYSSLLVEGVQNMRELLASEYTSKYIKDIYFSQSAVKKYPELYEKAFDFTLWVHQCTDEVLEAMSKDAQGIVAVLDSSIFSTDIDSLDFQTVKLAVILPEIQDPGNLGTIIRSCDAMGADAVFICKNSVDMSSPKVLRSCAGSAFHLPIFYNLDFKEVVRKCKQADIQVLGATGHYSAICLEDLIHDYYERRFEQRNSIAPVKLELPVAWVFGNEARGLSQSEKDICTQLIKISMPGNAESLNVATAAAICLHTSSLVQNS